MSNKRIYFDYASTTPIHSKVKKAMNDFAKNNFANPSGLYKEGVEARKVLEQSRTNIARIFGVKSDEVYFTGSGTESNNLAILGTFNFYKGKFKPHFITSEFEHSSILETMKEIERQGGEVTYIKPQENGIVIAKDVEKALKLNTVLVSVMYANNEIGTIQPISEIGRVIKKYRASKKDSDDVLPYFHTDASQAANYLTLLREALGIDMMTLDSSKFYGPKGAGILLKKNQLEILPIIFGGGQEGGLRSGTEDVEKIFGVSLALEIAQNDREKESERLVKLRDYFIDKVLKHFPNASLNGDIEKRLPNNINVCFPGIDAEFTVIKLDHEGISCSSVSACKNLSDDSSSYVISAIGKKECAISSLRFTLGRETTKKDIDICIEKLNALNL
ncbi:MAG: cysteine desulfurase family protein [Candidatus Paceibacterota bacterium]